MKYGDMLKEMRDPNLPAAKVEENARIFNEFGAREEKYKSWLRFADPDPHFRKVNAGEGDFEIAPIDGIRLVRNTAQAIPNNTETTILFNANGPSTSIIQPEDDGRLFYGSFGEGKFIAVVGVITWATSGAGWRGLSLNAYDESDVLQYGATLHASLPIGTVPDSMSFAGGFQITTVFTVKWLRVTCVQTSGGALNMNYCHASFFSLR